MALLVVALLVVAPLVTSLAVAQSPTMSPSSTYLGYRTALQKATKLDDLRPWFSKDGIARLDAMPTDQRAMMLGMVKDMSSAITNVRVVKETITGDRAELQVEGTDTGNKATTKAVVEIVREGGTWKFVKERWGG